MDKSFLSIDQNNLDREWLQQPSLLFEYSELAADARLAHEEARNNLEVVSAELDAEIREAPEDYGLTKVTESGIRSILIQQEAFQKASKKVRIAKHKQDICYAAVSALEHRKSALERLVTLHGQNYFSTPHSDKAGEDVVKETIKRHTRSSGRKRRQPKPE